MDANKFFTEYKRMCKSNTDHGKCSDECPLMKFRRGPGTRCRYMAFNKPEEIIKVVGDWSSTHPVMTRQDAILKLYPNIRRSNDNVVCLCPEQMGAEFKDSEHCYMNDCDYCRRSYWLQEVNN